MIQVQLWLGNFRAFTNISSKWYANDVAAKNRISALCLILSIVWSNVWREDRSRLWRWQWLLKTKGCAKHSVMSVKDVLGAFGKLEKPNFVILCVWMLWAKPNLKTILQMTYQPKSVSKVADFVALTLRISVNSSQMVYLFPQGLS